MTLPANCDTCNYPLMPWDDAEDTRCGNCGSTVKTWEHLTLAECIRRTRLIETREAWGAAVDRAERISVKGDVL